eukprot:CAMPEP_0180790422 /NCGR_PEP_ID=MMETSP1038_2-20121128/53217_1 /TAXON_ID=632150 /ORGANISM="Azadinium spinosum, Strain 3D9" /LENGTH=126 /DNA_ID=CAMNT_0022828393 /DNA_START=205 /DNA_END=582 /DNA_ORIENTATION=-
MPPRIAIRTGSFLYSEVVHVRDGKAAVDILIDTGSILLDPYMISVSVSETQCKLAEDEQPVLVCLSLASLFLQIRSRDRYSRLDSRFPHRQFHNPPADEAWTGSSPPSTTSGCNSASHQREVGSCD